MTFKIVQDWGGNDVYVPLGHRSYFHQLDTEPTEVSFKGVEVDKYSDSKKIYLHNLGRKPLHITGIRIVGEFLVSHDHLEILEPNQTLVIDVIFMPRKKGIQTGGIYIEAEEAVGNRFVKLTGKGIVDSGSGNGDGDDNGNTDPITLPIITVSNGYIVDIPDPVEPDTSLDILPLTLIFEDQEVDTTSNTKTINIENNTVANIEILSISVGSPFTVVNGGSYKNLTIPKGWNIDVYVTFKPTETTSYSKDLQIVTLEKTYTIPVSGIGINTSLSPLSTSGRKIIQDSDSKPVVLKAVNWFGAEGNTYTPHGLWAVNWKDLIDDIRGMGFNCIRLAYSGDVIGSTPTLHSIDYLINPDLEHLNTLEILDKIVDYCGDKGVYVVLDHHRRQAGDGADGTPVQGAYTKNDWISTWETMATRYKNKPAVIGADLHNEPHSLNWDSWAAYVEECGNAIHVIAPDWLIVVEGVGNHDSDHYWWGGYLKGVTQRPISLTKPNKVVYSPHEYGQSVGGQDWLSTDGNQVPNYPNNLYDIWYEYWSFIFYDNIAPLFIGEFGGKFGLDGNGNDNQPNKDPEVAWATELVKHLNGYKTALTAEPTEDKMSFAYWSYNPNSGDTGGLVQDDWETHQQRKLNILQPLLGGN